MTKAFSGCSDLTTIYSLNTTPPTMFNNDFSNSQYMTLNVYVPQNALAAYQNADGWKNFWNLHGIDPTGVKEVEAENGSAVYYDLRGNRLNSPKRGLNIINGKKFILR